MTRRLPTLDARNVDMLFAAVVAASLVAQAVLGHGLTTHERLITAVASVAIAVPLAFRRWRPGHALIACCLLIDIQGLAGGQLLVGPAPTDVGPVIVLLSLAYGVGAWLDTRAGALVAGAATTLVAVSAVVPGSGSRAAGLAGAASASFYSALIVLPGWFIGRLAREHARRGAAFRDLAERSQAERGARTAAAIASERVRIGGELQDIIAHSVTAMVVQAGGARLALVNDPDRARQSIIDVEQTGRQALADLRRLLGMLRKDDDPTALSPQPGLAQIGTLFEELRPAGLSCHVESVGEPIDLTPGVDLVAYRVVEEALRAGIAHGGQHGWLVIRYAPRELRIEVRGDRTVVDLDASMEAIAARVRLYDGTVRARNNADGFEVDARIPMQVAVS